MALVIAAQQRVHRDGPVLYKMLTKSVRPFVGRPWFIINAKVEEIHETDDGLTVGRIELDPGFDKDLFFVARFRTPFIDDDRVDVIGYFAGDYTYKNRIGTDLTAPAFAVAGMFKSGTIVAMNRIVRFLEGRHRSRPAPACAPKALSGGTGRLDERARSILAAPAQAKLRGPHRLNDKKTLRATATRSAAGNTIRACL